MIACSYSTVERYNDQFFAVCKGFMELEEFLAKL